MPWQELTDTLVLAEFNDSETDAYNTAKGDDAGTSLDQIISGVVGEFADVIAARGHVLDGAGTLPPLVIPKAIAMVRWRFLLALPTGKSLLSDERKAANEAGEKLLERIAEGKVGIVGPSGAAPASSAGSKRKIGGRMPTRNAKF
jgi:hypothetical protein